MALLVKGPRTEGRRSKAYCRIGKDVAKDVLT